VGSASDVRGCVEIEMTNAETQVVGARSGGRAWLLAATLWLAVSAASAADPAVVDGVVRNSATGLPVDHATVRLVGLSQGGEAYLGATDAEGGFHFVNVAPGDYRISAERAGFAVHDADPVRIGAGQKLRDVTIAAAPLAVVTGRVVDSEGEPARGAYVGVLLAEWQRGRRVYDRAGGAETNEAGEFRIAGLAAGRCRLYAIPPSQFAISEGPGEPESRPGWTEGAATFDLSPGQTLDQVELKLPMLPSFHLRGKVESGTDSGGFMPRMVLAEKMDNGRVTSWFVITGRIRNDGAFDLGGVPPGVYTVQAGRIPSAETEPLVVAVTSHDVNGMLLPKLQPATVKVRVEYRGDAEQKHGDPRILLQRKDGETLLSPTFAPRMTRKPEGGVFENVRAGRYEPVYVSTSGWHVESMTYAGQPLTDGAMDVMPGTDGQLEIVLAQGTATIAGKVKDGEGKSVAIVAENATPGNVAVYLTTVDGQGRFTAGNLAPGKYVVFAIGKRQEWPWQNAEFVRLLREGGAAADVTDKPSAEVEVAVLTEEALRRAADQIQ
jgi:hypothetical protein